MLISNFDEFFFGKYMTYKEEGYNETKKPGWAPNNKPKRKRQYQNWKQKLGNESINNSKQIIDDPILYILGKSQ